MVKKIKSRLQETDFSRINLRDVYITEYPEYAAALRDEALFSNYGIKALVKVPKIENNVDEYSNFVDDDFIITTESVVPKFEQYRQNVSVEGMAADGTEGLYPLEVLIPTKLHLPKNSRIVLTEMIDDLVMELVTKRYFTDGLSLYIGYSKDKIKGLNVSKKLDNSTCSFDDISKCILDIYNNNINKDFAVRRIGISFHITNNINKQLDLFSDIDDNEKEYSLLRNVSKIKNKYGKNSILRGISYTENANQLSRNKYVGGHNAE